MLQAKSFLECDDNPFDSVAFPAENKTCVKYRNGKVFFLLSRRGEAIEIHVLAIGRNGKLCLMDACKKIIDEVKDMFPWVKMLIAPVKLHSVYNLCLKLGFDDLGAVESPDHGKCRLMVINYG